MEKEVQVVKKVLSVKDTRFINHILTHVPKNECECFGEDSTYITSFDFGDGIEMDVKICGVQFKEGETDDNLPWTEAVLFKNGSEVSCTDVSDEYFGEWEIENDGVIYKAIVA